MAGDYSQHTNALSPIGARRGARAQDAFRARLRREQRVSVLQGTISGVLAMTPTVCAALYGVALRRSDFYAAPARIIDPLQERPLTGFLEIILDCVSGAFEVAVIIDYKHAIRIQLRIQNVHLYQC
jgi:hypothetical protein